MAYKVFTNGSTLQASEINDNLMRQSVMVFSNAAARTAAITVPLEGMLSYLDDVNRYESYNGTAWVSPFGETLLSTVTFEGATSVALNSLFTSTYNNYRLVMNIDSFSNTCDLIYRLRSGTTDNTANQYSGSGVLTSTDSSVVGVPNVNSLTNGYFGNTSSSRTMRGQINIFNPAVAVPTSLTSHVVALIPSMASIVMGNYHSASTAFDGINLICSAGNMAGTIRLYGLRNQS